MNICPFLVADPETPILMQPGQSAFHNPTRFSKATPVWASWLPKQRLYQPPSQLPLMGRRVIGRVTLKHFRPFLGPTPLAADWWNGLHQRQHRRHVVAVRLRDMDRKRNPLSICDEMVLCPLFTAIRGVRPRFGPAKVALTEELSISARLKSILFAPRNFDNNSLWMAFQTPARCHACRYRQQLIPLPHPNSWGSISHGMPLFSTKRIPVKARRGSIGLRPGFLFRRGFDGGRIPRMSSQRSSGTNSSTFMLSSQLRRAYPISNFSGSHYVRVS